MTRTIRPNKKLLDRRRRHHQQFLRLEMNPTSRRRKATQVDNKRDRMTLTCSTAPTRLRVGKNLERRKKKLYIFFFFKKDRSLSPFLSEQIFYFPSKKKITCRGGFRDLPGFPPVGRHIFVRSTELCGRRKVFWSLQDNLFLFPLYRTWWWRNVVTFHAPLHVGLAFDLFLFFARQHQKKLGSCSLFSQKNCAYRSSSRQQLVSADTPDAWHFVGQTVLFLFRF